MRDVFKLFKNSKKDARAISLDIEPLAFISNVKHI